MSAIDEFLPDSSGELDFIRNMKRLLKSASMTLRPILLVGEIYACLYIMDAVISGDDDLDLDQKAEFVKFLRSLKPRMDTSSVPGFLSKFSTRVDPNALKSPNIELETFSSDKGPERVVQEPSSGCIPWIGWIVVAGMILSVFVADLLYEPFLEEIPIEMHMESIFVEDSSANRVYIAYLFIFIVLQ